MSDGYETHPTARCRRCQHSAKRCATRNHLSEWYCGNDDCGAMYLDPQPLDPPPEVKCPSCGSSKVSLSNTRKGAYFCTNFSGCTEAYKNFDPPAPAEEHRTFETGSVRDSVRGKPRYGLIPVHEWKRVADLYGKGAELYADDNWRKGQPLASTYDSLQRHANAWARGETGEDHLAAVVWNALSLMYTERLVAAGKLPATLANMRRE